LPEEDDAGDGQGRGGQRAGEVIAQLLRLDQEQLRDTVQRSPELSHVEHCSRASGEFGRNLDAESKARRRGPTEERLLSLLRFSGHPREIFAPHTAYAHHAGRRVARYRRRWYRGRHQLDVDGCPATGDGGPSRL